MSVQRAQPITKPDDDLVLGRGDPRWQQLHDIIVHESLKIGDFILSSGSKSKFLFQLRQTTMLPRGAALLGKVILEYMEHHKIGCIGGLALGAVPLVSAVAVMSDSFGKQPVDAFFVRKVAKEHGARERVDGHVTPGSEVLLVDDVATSGQSILTAIEGLNQESPGSFVRRALVVVDREEGAAANLARRNIKLVSIFKKSDFDIPA
jgi:orotate phosphoribosyltransferase